MESRCHDDERIPHCTTNPSECNLCDMIRQIYKKFPTEVNPGCETDGQQVS